MIMNKIVEVGNEKAKAMIYTLDGVRFINKNVDSVDAFNEIFDKKLTMTDKGELLFSDMKKLNINGLTVDPNAGMKLGNSVSDITFKNENDLNEFVNHVSNLKGWSRKEKQSTIFNAIKWDVLGLIFTPIAAIYARSKALEIESGTFINDVDGYSKANRNERFFNNILETIGSTGVTVIALLVFAYLAYSIYNKYRNPPILVSYE